MDFYSSRQKLYQFRWIELTSQPHVNQVCVLARHPGPTVPSLNFDVVDFPSVPIEPEVDLQLDSRATLHFAMQHDVSARFLRSAPFDQLLQAALDARWTNEIHNLEFQFFREACKHGGLLVLIIRYSNGSFKVVFLKTNFALFTKWFATRFIKEKSAVRDERRLLGKTASVTTVRDDRDW